MFAPAWSANHSRAEGAAVTIGLRGERGAGGPFVLWIGRNLQHSAARHCEDVARAQSREYRRDRARRDRRRQCRMHQADRDRDGGPDCPHGRADRLGDGGPSAAGIARNVHSSAGMRFGPLATAIGRSNMAKKAKKSKAKAKKAKAAAAAPAPAPAAAPAMPSWMTPGSGGSSSDGS